MKSLLIILFLFAALASLYAQNIGIGTLTPQVSLHVQATDTGMLRLENTTTLATGVSNAIYFKTGNWFTGGIKQTGTSSNTSRTGFFGYAFTDPSGLQEYLSIVDAGNIGIGTITPNSKAALDISSTTRGLLPPRMNLTARSAIASPPAGLTIYNTSTSSLEFYNGTAWTSVAPPAATHSIGESFGGGIVFYVYNGGQNGLISATADQSTGIKWNNNASFTNTNAIRDGIGAFSYNTEHIIANQGAGSYAAMICAQYNGGGYGDWYLPSKYELNLLYLQKAVVGGFVNSDYWSSSEVDSDNAWFQFFDMGFQGIGAKNYTYHVRAVRAF